MIENWVCPHKLSLCPKTSDPALDIYVDFTRPVLFCGVENAMLCAQKDNGLSRYFPLKRKTAFSLNFNLTSHYHPWEAFNQDRRIKLKSSQVKGLQIFP